MGNITVTNDNRPSNDVIFGLIFEDKGIFKTTMECVLGEKIDETNYVVSQKENRMGGSVYNRIRFDVYAESDKIYTLDMQNGYTNETIRNRQTYYACRAVGGQEVKNFEYGKLKTCVVTFIFEKYAHGNKQFMTKYYMASEVGGKIVKYSDLLNVVELNLRHYAETDNADLNVLCEFLRIQDSGQLQAFQKKYGGGGFGEVLYDKYMKIVLDTDRIERVKNMGLYQEKYQSRYLTENDVRFYLEQGSDENKEKTAVNMLRKNKYTVEEISEATELSIERVEELKEQLK